jgi:hypothetical protein
MDRGDQIIRTYSPAAEDIDEALENMDEEIVRLRAEVGRLGGALREIAELSKAGLEATTQAVMRDLLQSVSLTVANLSAQPAPEKPGVLVDEVVLSPDGSCRIKVLDAPEKPAERCNCKDGIPNQSISLRGAEILCPNCGKLVAPMVCLCWKLGTGFKDGKCISCGGVMPPDLTAEEKRACDAFDIKRVTGKPAEPAGGGK